MIFLNIETWWLSNVNYKVKYYYIIYFDNYDSNNIIFTMNYLPKYFIITVLKLGNLKIPILLLTHLNHSYFIRLIRHN